MTALLGLPQQSATSEIDVLNATREQLAAAAAKLPDDSQLQADIADAASAIEGVAARLQSATEVAAAPTVPPITPTGDTGASAS